MAVARFEIEKFDGKGDFGLWKAKIKALLGQQKAHKALLDPSTLPNTVTAQEKEDWELAASENAADMLTKPTSKLKLLKCLELIGFDLPEKG